MQRSWESGTGGPGPETEMTGGGFLSRPRPCMSCSAWEQVSEINIRLHFMEKILMIQMFNVST